MPLSHAVFPQKTVFFMKALQKNHYKLGYIILP